IENALDSFEVKGIVVWIADAIVFDPCPALSDFQMQVEVRLCLRVYPDETLSAVTRVFDDGNLLFCDPPAYGVAADDSIHFLCCTGGGTKDFNFCGRKSVVTCAHFNPSRLNAAVFDLALQLAKHPFGKLIFAHLSRPIGYPLFAVNP